MFQNITLTTQQAAKLNYSIYKAYCLLSSHDTCPMNLRYMRKLVYELNESLSKCKANNLNSFVLTVDLARLFGLS